MVSARSSEVMCTRACWIGASGLGRCESVSSRFRRDISRSADMENFPTARTLGAGIEHLDELARNWITYWLLELGIRDFETWLAAQKRPGFLRIPELA